jgi:phage-related protein
MTIRIVQYLELTAFAPTSSLAANEANQSTKDSVTFGGNATFIHRYQNYFVNQSVTWPTEKGNRYDFMPFSATGTTANLNGDNGLMSITFPNVPVAIRLVEQGNGNRLSRLTLTTVWLNEELLPINREPIPEYYIGIGASFSETTIELRFRSAMDSVGSQFPGRKLTKALVGLLPLNADLFLQ